MFNLFKKKSQADILLEKYMKLQEEAFKLSRIDRAKSDAKYAEAEQVIRSLEKINPITYQQPGFS